MQRIKNQIISSQCFKHLRYQYGEQEFNRIVESKIVPIEGDLTIEHLGISEQDRQLIVDNVDVIINSAASVNFDDPL